MCILVHYTRISMHSRECLGVHSREQLKTEAITHLHRHADTQSSTLALPSNTEPLTPSQSASGPVHFTSAHRTAET